MYAKIAVIGGTGLKLPGHFNLDERLQVNTPYGDPSAPLTLGDCAGRRLVFLPRHGDPRTIAPDQINYQANIYALKEYGVNSIIAVNAVGGITKEMPPGRLVIPEQLIDYTYGRRQTFYDGDPAKAMHVDFSTPYSANLRNKLISLKVVKELNVFCGGIYGVTQGPRLETAAEITKLERDGCDIVGMTAMPEAVLARELGLDYVCLASVANWVAGKAAKEIDFAEIEKTLGECSAKICRVLEEFISSC